MARRNAEHSGLVTDDGERVRRRRERIGWDKKRLASEAGVARDTLTAIEGGKGFQRLSLVKIEQALSDAEAEMGLTEPPPAAIEGDAGMVEFRVEGLYGAETVVVKGPVADTDKLLAAVEKLMRGASKANEGGDADG